MANSRYDVTFFCLVLQLDKIDSHKEKTISASMIILLISCSKLCVVVVIISHNDTTFLVQQSGNNPILSNWRSPFLNAQGRSPTCARIFAHIHLPLQCTPFDSSPVKWNRLLANVADLSTFYAIDCIRFIQRSRCFLNETVKNSPRQCLPNLIMVPWRSFQLLWAS